MYSTYLLTHIDATYCSLSTFANGKTTFLIVWICITYDFREARHSLENNICFICVQVTIEHKNRHWGKLEFYFFFANSFNTIATPVHADGQKSPCIIILCTTPSSIQPAKSSRHHFHHACVRRMWAHAHLLVVMYMGKLPWPRHRGN